MTKQLIGMCGRCRQMAPMVSINPRRCKRCMSAYLPENQSGGFPSPLELGLTAGASIALVVIMAYLLANWILSL